MQPSVAPPPQRPLSVRASLWAYCSWVSCGLPGLLSRLALFQPLDVMAQLERRAQLQTHVLHDHVAPQQHQSFPVDLLQGEEGDTLVLAEPSEVKQKRLV